MVSDIRKGLVPGHRMESTQETGLINYLFNFLFLVSFCSTEGRDE